MSLIFDIETDTDRAKALQLMPQFDPAEVKCGNLKPENASAKIEEARKNHESAWLEKAALRPETSIILAIGYYDRDKGAELKTVDNMHGEKDLLADFWEQVTHRRDKREPLMGWNIFGFDLPTLVLRSRLIGIDVPSGIRKGRYWNPDVFCDLREDWLLGRNPMEVKSSLDYVARSFGVGQKNGDGSKFGELYRTDQVKALAYLRNDILLTKEVAQKLGHDFTPTGKGYSLPKVEKAEDPDDTLF